jgi:predicted type IV restriction endonuclease
MSDGPTSNGSVSESQPKAEAVRPASPAPARPKWETEARERVKNAVKKFNRPLADLLTRDANEGDTRLAVTDFLCEGLGYDKYIDLTTEYAVRGEFADYGVRIDKEIVAFIEVKRIATKLNGKHLRQVQTYAVNEGVEWMILTNGAEWQAYHLTGGLPVVTELALSVNLLGTETASQKAKVLFYLTRESFKKRQIDELWKARRASSPESLAKILRSESVLEEIRRELWRQTHQRLESEELLRLLEETVLRPECLEK